MPEKAAGRRTDPMLEKIRYDQRYASLLEVYRFGGYTAAAEYLSLTPSAVSQQIHSVERELEAKLFIRKKGGLVPTDTCRAVVGRVKQIQAVCKRMSDDIDLSRRHIDRLTIGVTPSVGTYLLTAVLSTASDTALPGQLTVTTDSADVLSEKLLNHEIDLAVVEGQCRTESFAEVMIDTDHLTAIVRKDSVYAENGLITVPQLFREKLILKPKTSGTRVLFDSALRSAGIDVDRLQVIMEIDNIDTIVRLVAAGYGISVLSRNACLDYAERGDVVPVGIDGIGICRPVRILYRPGDNMQSIIGNIQRYYNASMPAFTENRADYGKEGGAES